MKTKHLTKEHKHRKATKVPSQVEVRNFLKAIDRKVKKRTAKFYRKHRARAGRAIDFLAEKYGIEGTNTAKYWKLKGLCVLIGKEPSYL